MEKEKEVIPVYFSKDEFPIYEALRKYVYDRKGASMSAVIKLEVKKLMEKHQYL
jgi:hypothetical protein